MMLAGVDVGSTTVKAVLMEDGEVVWQDYQRHHTRQAEKLLEFLVQMEEMGFRPGRDGITLTGSGAGLISPLVGGRHVQEVVAVASAVERFHPSVRFVSEIGGEDMKTIFLKPTNSGNSKQIYMQSACSGGTGTFIEKTARKLGIDVQPLSSMPYDGMTLHRISSKCGIFAESDANSLVKGGVPHEEIIASLFEAVVYQNLATLTKGNTPLPEVLLLGGPNLFFRGLQEAWRKHLHELWRDRDVPLPDPELQRDLIHVPSDALYYACRGCIEIASREVVDASSCYSGTENLLWWIREGQHAGKAREGKSGLIKDADDLKSFQSRYMEVSPRPAIRREASGPVAIGCDFGSTTAKAVAMSSDRELLFSCYVPSRGNPIEDAKALFGKIRDAGYCEVGALGITGYGKDLLRDILGADVPVVETVAHATAALHFFPDADAICDVGGADVKIMLLRRGNVTDFRLNSQCSSGNGAFLQGVAERYNVPLKDYAERAFAAKSMPSLMMGCGVFLQSDIVNQQRKGWTAEEIMASLASVLPLNVWVYAGQFQNLRSAGRKFVLQGGTHLNLAVVKAQVDFITSKVPDADVMVHPYCGEAGAIGAALLATDHMKTDEGSDFRGFEGVSSLSYNSTTTPETQCKWCPVNCNRTFIDVKIEGGHARPWSKVPLDEGWHRVIAGNSCPRGLIEDAGELRVMKAKQEEARRANPNIGEMVRESAFRRASHFST